MLASTLFANACDSRAFAPGKMGVSERRRAGQGVFSFPLFPEYQAGACMLPAHLARNSCGISRRTLVRLDRTLLPESGLGSQLSNKGEIIAKSQGIFTPIGGVTVSTGSLAAKRHAGVWAPVIAWKTIIANTNQLAYAA